MLKWSVELKETAVVGDEFLKYLLTGATPITSHKSFFFSIVSVYEMLNKDPKEGKW